VLEVGLDGILHVVRDFLTQEVSLIIRLLRTNDMPRLHHGCVNRSFVRSFVR
jgi:hypothetical protein